MDQAPALHGSLLDLLLFCQKGRAAPEVDVRRREVAEALAIAVVGLLDNGYDGRLEFGLKVVVFQKNAVFERLVPASNPALRLW